jgi:multisubunit Na+/H+ antiporter MnhB subunit
MSIKSGMDNTKTFFLGLLTIGLIGLLFLIVYGNLSGNLGFASNTQGYNDTQQVIGNLTSGAVSFFGFTNVWFVLGAVALLIVIVVGIIGLVSKLGSSKGGFSS